MGDLTIVTLCHALANITRNRCYLVENSLTCRCVDDAIGSKATNVVSTAPEIMMSEVFLIFFVLGLWLSAIGFCLNQYKSLRRLETQVHYCVNRKDPLNIGEIKIVAREQDSIIYKKKRYSTVLDTHIDNNDLKAMHYIKEYLPKTIKTQTSSLAALVISRDDLTANIPLSSTTTHTYHTANSLSSPTHVPLTVHNESPEEQQQQSEQEPLSAPPLSLTSFGIFDTDINKPNGRLSYVHRTESGRLSTVGLTVPHTSQSSGARLSWNGLTMFETSRSTQLLSVPSNSLRSNRYSDGNISFPVPQTGPTSSNGRDEQLIDPRLISNTVRRSLLALHRESQENLFLHRTKEKTQSENDVHGSFTPWKIKMKSKLKRTHHQQQQQSVSPLVRHQPQIQSHSKTLSILPIRNNSKDQERRISEYATQNSEYRFSTPPLRNSLSINPTLRRSLKNYPKYSTQSTSESETTQTDAPMFTSVYLSVDTDPSKTIVEGDVQSSPTIV